jgi:hypothetical protein
MAEERCVLATVFKHLKFRPGGPKPELLPALISRAENGILMTVERR